MKTLPCLICLFLLPLRILTAQEAPAPAAPAAVEKFKVKLDRALKAGEKYEIKSIAAATQNVDLWFDGIQQPASSETIEMEAEGTMEVTAVTPGVGNISAITFTVKKFTLNRGKGAEDAFKEAAVISVKAQKDAPDTVTVDGAEADAEIRRVVLATLPTLTLGDESADLAFGTSAQKPVGEWWKCDTNAVAGYFTKIAEIEVKAEDSSASTRIARKVEIDGIECLVIEGKVALTPTNMPGLPEKADVKRCDMQLDMQQSMPVDGLSAPLAQRSVSDRDLEFEVPVKGGKTMKVRSSDRSERKITWKKL